MAKRCKGLNSKCFLFTYLIIVGFLLVLWMNNLPLMHEETREIPAELQNIIESPARPLPDFSLDTEEKLALTPSWFIGKWSFVTFTHSHCLPSCQEMLTTLSGLHTAFASKHIQFLAIGIDSGNDSVSELSNFLTAQKVSVKAVTASESVIDMVAHSFIALFLKTEYSDGSYIIEQEYNLFLVDPKGRVYATFKPPYNSDSISAMFFKLRHFYGRSE